MTPPVVPPIKCQGIKTKIVRAIRSLYPKNAGGRWIEPFCGSCVVAFNVRPERALLCDSNGHIIRFYADIQTGAVTGSMVKEYLAEQGARLRRQGEDVYYEIRDNFNREPTSLAFLFLNRACFNGVMRFNRKGRFNVPFCRKPERFAQAYITKITNQVRACAAILRSVEWVFQESDFRHTLSAATPCDFVYADPPYAGRHVDYYSSWSEDDEKDLAAMLKRLPCQFVLSTWFQNKYRTNQSVVDEWGNAGFTVNFFEHFYHVGSTEGLRNAMTEALISNFAGVLERKKKSQLSQGSLFDVLEHAAFPSEEIARAAEPAAASDRGSRDGLPET